MCPCTIPPSGVVCNVALSAILHSLERTEDMMVRCVECPMKDRKQSEDLMIVCSAGSVEMLGKIVK